MKGSGAYALAALVSFAPLSAAAQVVIDEVMYNPAGSDTGREWIELFNPGADDVTLVGGTVKGSWRVNDGANRTLVDPSGGIGRGALVVPAGGYLVVTNDPATFTSEYPGGTYSVIKSSMSLNNTGATVSLLDGTGTAVDSVAYTKDLGGYDDGSSLQKQADGTWIPAQPSPGAANSATRFSPPQATSTGEANPAANATQQSAPNYASSYVPPPTPSLYADAGYDRTVIVGADVEFDASAYDKSQSVVSGNVRFSWNFGDGTSAEGASVLHHFSYPGNYAVVLSIAQDRSAAMDRIIVTAEPAALSFAALSDGGVAIGNNAGHDLDLSGWVIRQSASPFAAQFILPERSLILSGSAMQIAAATLGFRSASSTTVLEYPNGAPALGVGENLAADRTPATSSVTLVHTAAAMSAIARPAPIVREARMQSAATSSATGTKAASSPAQAAAAGSATASPYLWWAGAVGAALLGSGAAYALKRYGANNVAGGWDIVEETGE